MSTQLTVQNEGYGDRRGMHTDEYNTVKTDIELLKRDVSTNHSLYSKMDSAIEKMAEVANQISKMLIIHENKIDNHGQAIDTMRATISERKTDVERQLGIVENRISSLKIDLQSEVATRYAEALLLVKEQVATAEKLEARISSLENWKWYILGIAAAVGFILSQLPAGISSLFTG